MACSQFSTNMNDAPQALVRSYSSDLQKRDRTTQNQLERIVVEEERLRQYEERDWRVYFEPWQPSAEEHRHAFLRKEGTHLVAAWKAFKDQFPVEAGRDSGGKAPTVTNLVELVSSLCSILDDNRKRSKHGIAKQYFHRFCSGLDDHATMLELLPAGSEYVSLFTGTIATIVKASVNHEKIAAEIAKSLSEITDVVAECTEMCQMYNTEEVQMRIAMLYAHIFLFLKDTMSWYRDKSWKRTLRSFNENFYDDFEEKILNIKNFAAQVKQQAEMGRSAEQRVTRLAVEQVQSAIADMRISTSGSARQVAEMAEAMKSMERKSAIEGQQKNTLMLESPEKFKALATFIGNHMFELLEARATVFSENVRDRISIANNSPLLASQATLSPEIEPIQGELVGREMYLAASRELETYFSREQMRKHSPSSASVVVNGEILHRLRDWVEDSKDPLLGIAGSSHLDHHGLSVMTKVAASFVDHADELGLPVISWFCELPTGRHGRDRATLEMTALLSLIYALVRQLIELLPLKPETPIRANVDDLSALDGTPASCDIAIRLFENLVRQTDLPLFIVVDGLQWLDDMSTSRQLEDFVSALTTSNARKMSSQVAPLVRVLFTTTGRSHALLDCLDTGVYLLADEGGRNRRGAGGDPLAW